MICDRNLTLEPSIHSQPHAIEKQGFFMIIYDNFLCPAVLMLFICFLYHIPSASLYGIAYENQNMTSIQKLTHYLPQ